MASAYDIFLEMAALERYDDGQASLTSARLVDLAYKVQHELEGALPHRLEAMRETGLTLCMAGGVAQPVANYTILKRCGLDDFFVFSQRPTTAPPQAARLGARRS